MDENASIMIVLARNKKNCWLTIEFGYSNP